jgi:hypothetical protein
LISPTVDSSDERTGFIGVEGVTSSSHWESLEDTEADALLRAGLFLFTGAEASIFAVIPGRCFLASKPGGSFLSWRLGGFNAMKRSTAISSAGVSVDATVERVVKDPWFRSLLGLHFEELETLPPSDFLLCFGCFFSFPATSCDENESSEMSSSASGVRLAFHGESPDR